MDHIFYVEFFYMCALVAEGCDINLLNNMILIYLARCVLCNLHVSGKLNRLTAFQNAISTKEKHNES